MADGSIIIDTRIDTGGVSKGLNAVKAGMTRISAQVSKMGDSAKSSFQRQITAITGLYQNYEKQERKVSELKSKLEELSKVRIETEEYKKLKEYKEELALGQDFYQQRRSLDILEKMAENQSTGEIANEAIGLGMGIGAANQFSNMFANVEKNANTTSSNSQIICPKCGSQNNITNKFCNNCGNKLVLTVVCPHCGKEIPSGMKFCGECGKSLCGTKCHSCGFDNKPGMKFCGNCGEKL